MAHAPYAAVASCTGLVWWLTWGLVVELCAAVCCVLVVVVVVVMLRPCTALARSSLGWAAPDGSCLPFLAGRCCRLVLLERC